MTYATRQGEGTIFKIALTTNPSTVFEGVNSIDLDGLEVASVDNWHMGSTVKTKRPSLMKDLGKVSVEADYDPADTVHKLVRDAHAAGTTVYWSITYVSGAKTTGTGFVSTFKIGNMGKGEDNLNCSFEIVNNDLAHADAT